MMRTIHLYGYLADAIGPEHRFDIVSPREAVSALCSQYPPVRQLIAEGRFEIVRGDLMTGFEYEDATIDFPLGKAVDLHIVPVLHGDKGRGGKAAIKIVVGVTMIAAGVGFGLAAAAPGVGFMGAMGASTGFLGITYGQIAFMGASLLLGGIASLISPSASNANPGMQTTDERRSFMFQGLPQNLSEQGNPVPLVYGDREVGGVVVAVGLSAQDIAV